MSMVLHKLQLTTPDARDAYIAITTRLLQMGASPEEAFTHGAKTFSKWLSHREGQDILVTPQAMRMALPVNETLPQAKILIGLFISAEIISGIVDGKTTEKAVRDAFQHFNVTATESFLKEQIETFSKERERVDNLKPHQMDNGAGGVVEIVNEHDSSRNKKDLMSPERRKLLGLS